MPVATVPKKHETNKQTMHTREKLIVSRLLIRIHNRGEYKSAEEISLSINGIQALPKKWEGKKREKLDQQNNTAPACDDDRSRSKTKIVCPDHSHLACCLYSAVIIALMGENHPSKLGRKQENEGSL